MAWWEALLIPPSWTLYPSLCNPLNLLYLCSMGMAQTLPQGFVAPTRFEGIRTTLASSQEFLKKAQLQAGGCLCLFEQPASTSSGSRGGTVQYWHVCTAQKTRIEGRTQCSVCVVFFPPSPLFALCRHVDIESPTRPSFHFIKVLSSHTAFQHGSKTWQDRFAYPSPTVSDCPRRCFQPMSVVYAASRAVRDDRSKRLTERAEKTGAGSLPKWSTWWVHLQAHN